MSAAITTKAKKIKMLVLDVDGVLTNGKIVIDHKGEELKFFDVQDGFGIVFFKKAGYKVGIISARAAKAVVARAKDLKIDRVYQDAYPKTNALNKILKEFKLKASEVCFMGDDLPDICVLKKVGLAVAVKNASAETKKAAHYVTKNNGGDGAIREVIELILKAQGKWKNVVNSI